MYELQNCTEYTETIKLEGLASRYISIPAGIILNTSLDYKRVAILSYCLMRRGLDYKLNLSVPSLVNFCGFKSNSHVNAMNDKTIDVIEHLKKCGYFSFNQSLHRTKYNEITVNYDFVYEQCLKESFAVLYLDEIYEIMEHTISRANDSSFNPSIVLLVFAFIRNVIYRRSNKLRPEELNVMGKQSLKLDIEERRKRSPEAYTDNFKSIAEKLGISERQVSESVNVLEDLGLIVRKDAYHFKNEYNQYRTQYLMIANTYKREGGVLLAQGEEYYIDELKRKEANMQEYYKHYKLKLS